MKTDAVQKASREFKFAPTLLFEDAKVGFGGVGAATDELRDDFKDAGGRARIS